MRAGHRRGRLSQCADAPASLKGEPRESFRSARGGGCRSGHLLHALYVRASSCFRWPRWPSGSGCWSTSSPSARMPITTETHLGPGDRSGRLHRCGDLLLRPASEERPPRPAAVAFAAEVAALKRFPASDINRRDRREKRQRLKVDRNGTDTETHPLRAVSSYLKSCCLLSAFSASSAVESNGDDGPAQSRNISSVILSDGWPHFGQW